MAVVKRRPVPRTGDSMDKKRRDEITDEKEIIDNELEAIREKMEQEKYNQEVEEKLMEERKEIVTMNNPEQEQSNYELDMFQPSVSQTTSRGNFKAGAMSIVKSNCGKRITISKKVMDKLNNPSRIVISFSDERIAIGEYLPNNNNQLDLKMVGKKGIIYSASLVTEIAEKYKLDFSTRTSMTFTEVNYVESNGYTVAIIKIK